MSSPNKKRKDAMPVDVIARLGIFDVNATISLVGPSNTAGTNGATDRTDCDRHAVVKRCVVPK